MKSIEECTMEQQDRILQALEKWCEWINQWYVEKEEDEPYTPDVFTSGDGSLVLQSDSETYDFFEDCRVITFLAYDGDCGGPGSHMVWFSDPNMSEDGKPRIEHYVYGFDLTLGTVVERDPKSNTPHIVKRVD